MTDALTLSALAESLTTTLGDARNRHADADAPTRHIRVAVADLHRVRPHMCAQLVTLSAGQERYLLNDNAVAFHSASWVARWLGIAPWDRAGVVMPSAVIRHSEHSRALELLPAPTSPFLAMVGRLHTLHYYAQHTVGEQPEQTSVAREDRALVILRAQAEAMKEIALANSGKPGTFKGGDASMPRNSTPAAVYRELMAEFERS